MRRRWRGPEGAETVRLSMGICDGPSTALRGDWGSEVSEVVVPAWGVGAPPFDATITKRRSCCGLWASGVTRAIPDLAPMWWTSISGVPARGPPTRPSFARNSAMILLFEVVGVFMGYGGAGDAQAL
jgi:hypothetical protein